jgi:hypothetical protein
MSFLKEIPRGGATMPDSFEIMHIFWNPAFEKRLELPPSFAGFFSMQIRRYGSDTSLLLQEPLLRPIKFSYPMRSPVPPDADNTLGTRRIAFGAGLLPDSNWKNWEWSTNRLELLDPPAWSKVPILVMQHYSIEHVLFSVSKVEEGCDGKPKSKIYNDDCRVCGGDNSTCSGCDRMPNTGRDKGCSGHGKCLKIEGMPEIRCKCVAQWFDIMCSTFCDFKITCSGHGIWFFSPQSLCTRLPSIQSLRTYIHPKYTCIYINITTIV